MADTAETTKPPSEATAAPRARWLLPVTLVVLLLLLALAASRLAPPAPLPADAPPERFSAGRAGALLAKLAGDGSPHPTGSAANARVRETILAELRRLGYQPRVEEGFVCGFPANCATVRNVVAELPGKRPDLVALVAHYDSVAAGPGVSDDLTGVAAILEAARILKAGPPPGNSILLLLLEGEENGLLGAVAFADQNALAARVRAAVNLEARGTSGPSLMFETSRDNRWLMPLLDLAVERPVASSLFQTIYEYLPNNTDFTVLKNHGIAGFNFAFVGDAPNYHSGADTLAHSTPGSLQHHGDNALAAIRALAAANLSGPPPQGRAVFFDVLGYELFWWPATRGTVLGVVALALVLASVVLLFRRRQLRGGSFVWGFAAWLGTVVVTAAVAFGLVALLGVMGAIRTPWPGRSLPPQVGMWLLALGFAGVFALRRAGFQGLWAGVWTGWAVLGLVLAAALAPGASYLFLLPAIAAGVSGFALSAGPWGRALGAVIPAVVAAVLWFPLLMLLWDGLGLPLLWLIGALAAIVATTLLPVFAVSPGGWRWGVTAAALVVAVIMLIGVVASPPFSPASPQPLNLAYHEAQAEDTAAPSAHWVVPMRPPLPETLKKAAPFAAPAVAYPWSAPLRAFVADAPALPLPAPELTILEQGSAPGGRRVRLRITSPRGAATVGLIVPRADLQSLAIAGRPVPLVPVDVLRAIAGFSGIGPDWRRLQVAGPPPEGIEMELVLSGAGPSEAYVFDSSVGLPPEGAGLVAARPASATTQQDGDQTLVSRKVKL